MRISDWSSDVALPISHLRRLDGHSSGTSIAERLARPTRMAGRKPPHRLAPAAIPIWSCSRWGLPCRFRYRSRGALLPHPFTLTMRPPIRRLACHGGLLSVALSLGRSEEHTSELQSLMRISYAVFCLKKTKIRSLLPHYHTQHSHTIHN